MIINIILIFRMEKSCINNLCLYKYNAKKKPFKCPECDAYLGKRSFIEHTHTVIVTVVTANIIKIVLGGKFVPTPDSKKKKVNGKVVKLDNNLYSVHTNQIYRTVCHVPPGEILF